MKGKRVWRFLILGFVLLLVALAAFVFWPHTESLDALLSAGEGYDVRILRDTWGVPHIYGVTDEDTAFGLAFAHAEDDFLTIQQTAAATRGILASIEGPGAAPIDYIVQLLRVNEVVEEKYSTLCPKVQAICEAYADGLNYYAALHPEETLPGLFPADGKLVVAGSVLMSPMFFGIENTLIELFEGPKDEEGSKTAAQFNSWINLAASAEAKAFFFTGIPVGSNTFSVAPSRTAAGETYLAVNSHQPWEGPVTWYEAHLHSEEGWDMVGSTFPGVPAIVHGHNRQLGWAFTVNAPDMVDVYELEIHPENEYLYRFDGEWIELVVREVPIKVKLLGNFSWTVKEEALWSVYGPVLRNAGGAFAVRYGGYGEVSIYEQLYYMNKAEHFEEWKDALSRGGLPIFNIGYADAQGNIYYIYNAMIPLRSQGYDWEGTLPGNTSDTLWTQHWPFEQLPQVFNPPSGFIQNCNSSPFKTTSGDGNPRPEDFCPTMGIKPREGNRMLRALELFGENEAITYEDFYNYKYDMYYSKESDTALLIEMLFTMELADEPDIREALTILKNWDLSTDPGSRGAALAVLTILPVAQSGIDNIRKEELVESFYEAIATLKQHHGRLDPPWEEVNRLRRGEFEIGLGGGPDILHAVYGNLEEGRYYGMAGDSYVLLVAWDAEGRVRSESIHQFGSATLDQDSPHYADQAPLFVERKLKPVWMDEAVIRANLSREYRP